MPDQTPVIKLLLTSKQAATALSICERLLWAKTAPRGPIPCIRLGRRVLYAVKDLEAFIAAEKGGAR